MLIQLDAAQVIDLIDGKDQELRELLSSHICAVSTSVFLDLHKKSDQPGSRYRDAFQGLDVRWGIDAGMIASNEIRSGCELLAEGRTTRTAQERQFPFRNSFFEATSVRSGVPVPLAFASKGLGDLFSDPAARAAWEKVRTAGRREDLWRRQISEPTGVVPPRKALLKRARSICTPTQVQLLEAAEEKTVFGLFPAFLLARVLRNVAHQDKKATWTHNDIVDFFHAPQSAYCDAMFADAKMVNRLSRASKALGLTTHYVPNGMARQFLRSHSQSH